MTDGVHGFNIKLGIDVFSPGIITVSFHHTITGDQIVAQKLHALLVTVPASFAHFEGAAPDNVVDCSLHKIMWTLTSWSEYEIFRCI